MVLRSSSKQESINSNLMFSKIKLTITIFDLFGRAIFEQFSL